MWCAWWKVQARYVGLLERSSPHRFQLTVRLSVERRIHVEIKRAVAFSEKICRHLLPKEHKTNDWVQSKTSFLVDPQKPLLATVKRWKLAWFGHVTRHDNFSKTILQGTLEVGRRRGRQRKCWMDNIKEWTSLPMSELLTMTSCREDWKTISAESSFMPQRQPNRSRDWTELTWFSGETLFFQPRH